jgi:hypothetical protein
VLFLVRCSSLKYRKFPCSSSELSGSASASHPVQLHSRLAEWAINSKALRNADIVLPLTSILSSKVAGAAYRFPLKREELLPLLERVPNYSPHRCCHARNQRRVTAPAPHHADRRHGRTRHTANRRASRDPVLANAIPADLAGCRLAESQYRKPSKARSAALVSREADAGTSCFAAPLVTLKTMAQEARLIVNVTGYLTKTDETEGAHRFSDTRRHVASR